MKTIDLKKFYSKPELYEESNLVDVTDEVAYVLEQSIRDERNSYMKCYRAKAYYSLDYGKGVENYIIVHEERHFRWDWNDIFLKFGIIFFPASQTVEPS